MKNLNEPIYKSSVAFVRFLKWFVFSILTGFLIGQVCALFYYGLSMATSFRESHGNIIIALPVAGLFIVWIYRFRNKGKMPSTNLVLSSIHSNDSLPIRTMPLIFVSTIITHLFGGSAGREGAALQMGGSIGNDIAKLLKFDDKDRRIFIMCGMSAAFSALFGTPMTASIFAIEVVSVGIMYYSALVPCVAAALVSSAVSRNYGIAPEMFHVANIPEVSMITMGKICVLGICCALVSIMFCLIMMTAEKYLEKWLKNPYLKIFLTGTVIVILTYILGTRDYNGAGMNIIEKAVEGEVKSEAFFLKMIFTALTLASGYKGGEIVPTLFVGATFGCIMGKILGISPELCASVSMGAVFCGVTNCPISSLLLCLELFGMNAMPYYLAAIAISYMLSGYYSLYHSQKIMYSKYKSEYINITANG